MNEKNVIIRNTQTHVFKYVRLRDEGTDEKAFAHTNSQGYMYSGDIKHIKYLN